MWSKFERIVTLFTPEKTLTTDSHFVLSITSSIPLEYNTILAGFYQKPNLMASVVTDFLLEHNEHCGMNNEADLENSLYLKILKGKGFFKPSA